MKLSNLTKIKNKNKRRIGRGFGSGRGKTGGRGTSGQKARNKIPLSFEGGALSLIKRLPFRRGKGRNKVFKKKPVIVNIKALNLLKKNSLVDLKALVDNNIVDQNDAKNYGVKILGDGEIKIPLTIRVSISKSAGKKIEKAGGRVERD